MQMKAINSPQGMIEVDEELAQELDYEAERAVVIGRGGRFIGRDVAMNHVFGYTVLNDVTARDLQQKHKQWFLGKGIDGSCPMGPWIVTADEWATILFASFAVSMARSDKMLR